MYLQFSQFVSNAFLGTYTHGTIKVQNCEGCPLRRQCFKGKENRSIERNYDLERHKQKTRELLTSETGKKIKQRTANAEPVFMQLKYNHNFRQFSLKGIEK